MTHRRKRTIRPQRVTPDTRSPHIPRIERTRGIHTHRHNMISHRRHTPTNPTHPHIPLEHVRTQPLPTCRRIHRSLPRVTHCQYRKAMDRPTRRLHAYKGLVALDTLGGAIGYRKDDRNILAAAIAIGTLATIWAYWKDRPRHD